MKFANRLVTACTALAAAAMVLVPNDVSATPVSAAVADMEPYTISRSATFQLTSAAGERYDILVAWPEGTPPPAGWPVLYVLDGEDNFAIAALTARRLARAGARSGIQDGIVVGIGAGPLARRVHDYTPPVPGYRIPAGKPAAGLEIGGGDAFLDFLTGNVMPRIGESWPVDKKREALVGHSFGGLIALHAYAARPGIFDTVVAVSPSLWFGDGTLVKEVLSTGPASDRRLLVAEGEESGRGGASEETHPGSLVRKLQATDRTATISYLPLPGQTHGTTMLAALVPAIRLAFGMEKP